MSEDPYAMVCSYFASRIARVALTTVALTPALARATAPVSAPAVESIPHGGARSPNQHVDSDRSDDAVADTPGAPAARPSSAPTPTTSNASNAAPGSIGPTNAVTPATPAIAVAPADVAAPASAASDPARAGQAASPSEGPVAAPSPVPPSSLHADPFADDPRAARPGRRLMIGGFATLGAAYLSTTFIMGLSEEGRARLAVPVVGPLLAMSDFDATGRVALAFSAAVQATGLALGTVGALRYARDDRARRPSPTRGRGLLVAGGSIFGASYLTSVAAGALLSGAGLTEGAYLYVPVAGPLVFAAQTDAETISAPLVATSVVQAAGLTMGIVGAVRLARSKSRALAINGDGVRVTRSGLRVNVGPTPRMDGGVVQLTYRW